MENIKYRFKAKIEVKLTDQDIDDIMSSALDGGIGYWCEKAVVVGGKYFGEYASEQISRGGSLMLHHEDGKNELTIKNLLKGIKRVIAEGRLTVNDGRIDCGDVDGEIADMIVQYAIFDELVFG